MSSKWPFASMSVGDAVIVNGPPAGRIQAYAHVFARSRGWKFRTQSLGPNRAVAQRLHDDGTTPKAGTKTEVRVA